MQDKIQKLYELAGIDRFDYELAKYPDFTDSKQLELIKWLMLDSMHDELSLYFHQPTQTFVFDLYYVPEIRGCRNNRANCNTDFSQALAGLVCELWEELTPEQREEVKRILE